MGWEANVPMILSGSSSKEGATILTSASTFFCLSSEMNSCFPTARPRYVTSSEGGSEGSTCLPAVEDHSTVHSGGTVSPEIVTVTLGGLRSSRPGAVSFHHELPMMIAVGGGHRNLYVCPMNKRVIWIRCGSSPNSTAHEIDAPAFLSIRLLGDLTGHDDNGPLAKCYTITCFDIFLQHRPNDAECIGASEFGDEGNQDQLKHEEKIGFNLRVAANRRRVRIWTHLMKLAISDPPFVTDASAGKIDGE